MWQGMDQRQFPRAQCQCVVNLRQEGRSSPSASVTENIGLGGVCVLLDKEVGIFSVVRLELDLKDAKPPLEVQGTVVWVVRRTERKKGPRFDTGIEFTELSGDEKARLEAVMDRAIQGKSLA